MLSRALEKQDEAVGVCVWTRIGVLTLRGCGGFVLEGEVQCGPIRGAAGLRKVSRWERKTGYGPFHQEQGLQSINFNVMQIGLWKC